MPNTPPISETTIRETTTSGETSKVSSRSKKGRGASATHDKQSAPMAPVAAQEYDDFGLPIRKFVPPPLDQDPDVESGKDVATEVNKPAAGSGKPETAPLDTMGRKAFVKHGNKVRRDRSQTPSRSENMANSSSVNSDDEDFQDAPSTPLKTPVSDPAPDNNKSHSDERNKTPVPITKVEEQDSKKKPVPSPLAASNADSGPKSPTTKSDESIVAKNDEAPVTDNRESPATKKVDITSTNKAEATEDEKAEATDIKKIEIPEKKPKSKKAESPAPDKRQRSDTTSSVQAISGPSFKEVEASKKAEEAKKESVLGHSRDPSAASATNVISEYSHQQLTAPEAKKDGDDDDEWQTMPAYAPYDIYDDDNKLVAKEHNDDEDAYGYAGLGGAGKGYTRVLLDEDAESETSMDGNTKYLFKEAAGTSMADNLDDETRDAVSQLQATKHLLTEGQRIAYVGVTRLELYEMIKEAEAIEQTKKTKKETQLAAEAMRMWSQKIMVRVYAHMEISPAEQIMIEQLAAHGVMPQDLTPVLMQNARVKNPMAEEDEEKVDPDATPKVGGPESPMSPRSPPPVSSPGTPRPISSPKSLEDEMPATAPPPYESHEGEEMPEVKTPSQLPSTEKIDIDLRWTVLCDLFLVLIADSIYDARSRVLLERVGKALEVPWIDICRFEKRVTDALEMQQQAEKENWNEEEHLENRRKLRVKRRYVMMGLATVGGGLVIGLSAGLLAPLIGAGLAAGFTTIGVSGTGTFLAGAGGAAIITSGAAASGSFMGGKAAGRRMGAVKTFEYRPLHNNKRVNLIVTVSGWMTSKVDDVRLPFSTVDSIMGDIYSILWEPEMLTSMGDTINILATEALTQGLQQVLGSTILIGLMAALQLPVVLSKLAYLIDNPWAVSLDRAHSAGLILADSLIDRNLGTRPITLVGYSLGSRVIYSCLQELARKGAFGLVQNVYIFGSPIVVKKDDFLKIRTVVAGRFVSGYNRNDWILGYLFRLTNGGIRRIAGLATIDDVPGIENLDCTEFVVGHMDYRQAMPRLLRECGWLVESDEFTEIEDPDPDKHRDQQRELMEEIEEARKELEKGDQKKGFAGFFSRKKKAQRAEWEVYEEKKGGPAGAEGSSSRTEDKLGNNHGILFDVDAMRAELAKDQNEVQEEEFQVRELKSTLPPMKLDLSSPPAYENPRNSLRETKSEYPATTLRTVSFEANRLSQERTPTLPNYSRFDPSPTPSPGPSRSYYEDPGMSSHHDDSDGIQMTFDSSIRDPEPPQPPAKDTYLSPTVVRPEMRTSQTTPNVALQDPWADDDDAEFGKEKELTMTFA